LGALTSRELDLASLMKQRVESFSRSQGGIRAFELITLDGRRHLMGNGDPTFTVRVVTPEGQRAATAFDELAIAEGYLNGDLDFEGSMMDLLQYREMISDPHPLQYLVSTYLEGFMGGQVRSDKRWIKSHYDIDPDFFVLWLDSRIRGYSHGFFERDDESLEDGMERKFRYAMRATNIRPGDRVLDIGGGWGSFLEFAGKQGVHVTSVTISDVSVRFMNEVKARHKLNNCNIVKEHFLDFRTHQPFDAIINLGVTEHLPDYQGTVKNYERLLKPGGRVYLDAYSGERFSMPTFILRWIYEGNTSPLNPKRYFAALENTHLEVMEFTNDRHNYELTCRKWAEKLEAARAEVVKRWGELLYRRFHIYLWGSADAFARGTLCAHHMVLQKPLATARQSKVPRALKFLG
jgi:cyclopropane-fatty-acyl-phospholipid synthase